MMETDEEEDDVFGKEEDPAPLCDFGVFVEEVGDLILTIRSQILCVVYEIMVLAIRR